MMSQQIVISIKRNHRMDPNRKFKVKKNEMKNADEQ